MEAVLGLFVMLLSVSHGVETSCDGRQDGAQCYGALGGTVVIQLMDNASGIARFDTEFSSLGSGSPSSTGEVSILSCCRVAPFESN